MPVDIGHYNPKDRMDKTKESSGLYRNVAISKKIRGKYNSNRNYSIENDFLNNIPVDTSFDTKSTSLAIKGVLIMKYNQMSLIAIFNTK
jgi:hypothetical protein